jgi:hypothetical protein
MEQKTSAREGSYLQVDRVENYRRLQAQIEGPMKKGKVSMQLFSQSRTFTIIDTSTTNNSCGCSIG